MQGTKQREEIKEQRKESETEQTKGSPLPSASKQQILIDESGKKTKKAKKKKVELPE